MNHFLPSCPMTEPRCFARDYAGHCRALHETQFNGRSCPFYRTPGEYRESLEAAEKRLRQLGRKDLIRGFRKSDGAREIQKAEAQIRKMEDSL